MSRSQSLQDIDEMPQRETERRNGYGSPMQHQLEYIFNDGRMSRVFRRQTGHDLPTMRSRRLLFRLRSARQKVPDLQRIRQQSHQG